MSDERPQRPHDDNRDAWKAYWTTQGMPWRTEPEVDAERQAFLAERLAIKADTEAGTYPFKDIMLVRADVEWLLATPGARDWYGANQESGNEERWRRDGMDLRGADLRRHNLDDLPLSTSTVPS